MRSIYNWLSRLFKPKRTRTLAEFTRRMDAGTRASIAREVAILRGQNAVVVQDLSAQESATPPRPANPEDEARLPPMATTAAAPKAP